MIGSRPLNFAANDVRSYIGDGSDTFEVYRLIVQQRHTFLNLLCHIQSEVYLRTGRDIENIPTCLSIIFNGNQVVFWFVSYVSGAV